MQIYLVKQKVNLIDILGKGMLKYFSFYCVTSTISFYVSFAIKQNCSMIKFFLLFSKNSSSYGIGQIFYPTLFFFFHLWHMTSTLIFSFLTDMSLRSLTLLFKASGLQNRCLSQNNKEEISTFLHSSRVSLDII